MTYTTNLYTKEIFKRIAAKITDYNMNGTICDETIVSILEDELGKPANISMTIDASK